MEFAALAFAILAAAGMGFAVNQSSNSEYSSLLMRNIEAMAQNEDSDFKYKIDKDSCKFPITIDMDLGKLGEWMKELNLGSPSVGIEIDLTDLTKLYKLGGEYRLGEDVTCSDIKG